MRWCFMVILQLCLVLARCCYGRIDSIISCFWASEDSPISDGFSSPLSRSGFYLFFPRNHHHHIVSAHLSSPDAIKLHCTTMGNFTSTTINPHRQERHHQVTPPRHFSFFTAVVEETRSSRKKKCWKFTTSEMTASDCSQQFITNLCFGKKPT